MRAVELPLTPALSPQAGRGGIVAAARGWLGTPYHHRMSVKGEGCDCIGLVRGVWRDVVGEEPCALPAYGPDWAEVTARDWLIEGMRAHFRPAALEAAEPGDVVVFRMHPGVSAKHAAILSVGGMNSSGARIIHAYCGRAVVESWLGTYWRGRAVAAFRFPLAG